MKWTFQQFEELSNDELYAVMRLRQEVFVVEQECAFLDADGLDDQALHLCGWQGQRLLAYARLFKAGVVKKQASIGRVVSHPDCRGEGLGIALMNQAVDCIKTWAVGDPVWIGAQERLCPFYARFGFVETGERYLEDGIWHRGMQAACEELTTWSVGEAAETDS